MEKEKKQEQEKKKIRDYSGIIKVIVFIAIVIVGVEVIGGNDNRSYSQDETVTYEGVKYSITKVETDDECIMVTVKINNKSDKTVSYDDLYFNLLNQKGKQFDKKPLVIDDGTILPSGKLKPNEKVEGKIVWLKEDYKNLRVRYYENSLMADIDDYKFEWSLDLKR